MDNINNSLNNIIKTLERKGLVKYANEIKKMSGMWSDVGKPVTHRTKGLFRPQDIPGLPSGDRGTAPHALDPTIELRRDPSTDKTIETPSVGVENISRNRNEYYYRKFMAEYNRVMNDPKAPPHQKRVYEEERKNLENMLRSQKVPSQSQGFAAPGEMVQSIEKDPITGEYVTKEKPYTPKPHIVSKPTTAPTPVTAPTASINKYAFINDAEIEQLLKSIQNIKSGKPAGIKTLGLDELREELTERDDLFDIRSDIRLFYNQYAGGSEKDKQEALRNLNNIENKLIKMKSDRSIKSLAMRLASKGYIKYAYNLYTYFNNKEAGTEHNIISLEGLFEKVKLDPKKDKLMEAVDDLVKKYGDVEKILKDFELKYSKLLEKLHKSKKVSNKELVSLVREYDEKIYNKFNEMSKYLK